MEIDVNKLITLSRLDNQFIHKYGLLIVISYVILYIIFAILTNVNVIKVPPVSEEYPLRNRIMATSGLYYTLAMIRVVLFVICSVGEGSLDKVLKRSIKLMFSGGVGTVLMLIFWGALLVFTGIVFYCFSRMFKLWIGYFVMNKLLGIILVLFDISLIYILLIPSVIFSKESETILLCELAVLLILSVWALLTSGTMGTASRTAHKNTEDDEPELLDILLLKSKWDQNRVNYESGYYSKDEFDHNRDEMRNTETYKNLKWYDQDTFEK